MQEAGRCALVAMVCHVLACVSHAKSGGCEARRLRHAPRGGFRGQRSGATGRQTLGRVARGFFCSGCALQSQSAHPARPAPCVLAARRRRAQILSGQGE
eukprot:scaffold46753_cov258-Isochrysis_galbana.AAC.2